MESMHKALTDAIITKVDATMIQIKKPGAMIRYTSDGQGNSNFYISPKDGFDTLAWFRVEFGIVNFAIYFNGNDKPLNRVYYSNGKDILPLFSSLSAAIKQHILNPVVRGEERGVDLPFDLSTLSVGSA